MGLDNIIYYGINDHTNLSEDIIRKIHSNVDNLSLITGSLTECLKYKFISFRGKIYHDVILELTGFGLYRDLSPSDLQNMYEKLNEYIEFNRKNFDKIDMLLSDDENRDAIEMYINLMGSRIDKIYPSSIEVVYPSYIEILCKLFKVMSENNLWLIASY